MDRMKVLLNQHALKSLLKSPEIPDVSLAVGEDEKRDNVPLLIFTEQHLPMPTPEIVSERMQSYEDVQLDGTGASLSLDYFSTDNFSIGSPY